MFAWILTGHLYGVGLIVPNGGCHAKTLNWVGCLVSVFCLSVFVGGVGIVLYSFPLGNPNPVNKSNVVWHCLYSYRQRYMSSQWSKCCGVTRRSREGPQQILTTVMTNIVVDKSADNAKPHSICFLPQYQPENFYNNCQNFRVLIDVSSVVQTLIDNGKLANHIERLETIVVKV